MTMGSLGLGFSGLTNDSPMAPAAKPMGIKKNPKLTKLTKPKGTGAMKVPKGPKGPVK